jgi:cytidine deaminase
MIIPGFNECYHDHKGSMHGAYLFMGKKLIAVGRNRSDRTTARVDGVSVINRSLHAEIAVLSKVLRWRMDVNYTLIVVRYRKNGELACSKPCAHCITVINRLCNKYNLKCRYST